jgi:CysZ protein
MLTDFLSGFRYFFKGARIIKEPGIRRFVIIPFFINALIFTLALWLGINQFDGLVEWLLPDGEAWWIEVTRIALWVVFSAAAFLIVFFTITLIANLVGAPFNGLLSEKVERLLSGEMSEDTGGIRALFASIFPSIVSELRKLIYFIAIGIVIALLVLLPGINVLSPLLWGIFSSWMLALEYIAYPMESHNMYFSQARAELKTKKAITFGFGFAVMLVTMIPFVNFIVMPSAVAGATVMWVERLSRTDISMNE